MATLKAKASNTPWSAAFDTQPAARAEGARIERSRLTAKIEAMADAVRRQETTYDRDGPAHDLETQIRAINARIEQLTHTSSEAAPGAGARAGTEARSQFIEVANDSGHRDSGHRDSGHRDSGHRDSDRTLDLRHLVRGQVTSSAGNTGSSTDAAQPGARQSNAQPAPQGRPQGGTAQSAPAATDADARSEPAQQPPTRKRRGQERVPELRSLRHEDERVGRTVPLLGLLVGGAAILGGLYYTYGDGGAANLTFSRSSLSAGLGSSNDPIATDILELGNPAAPETGSAEPLGTRFAVAGIEGEAGTELAIQVMLPRSEIAPESLLLIRGIPEGASVKPAQRIDKDWAVRLEDLEDLRLVTPQSLRGWFPFEAVLQRNGNPTPETRIASIEILAPRNADLSGKDDGADDEKTLFPGANAAKPKLSAEIETQMMERGEALMRNGDVAGARLAFQHLALRGSGRGAMALGKTFDPEQLRAAGIRGLAPDADQAAEWYTKAAELGLPEAKAALQALAQ